MLFVVVLAKRFVRKGVPSEHRGQVNGCIVEMMKEAYQDDNVECYCINFRCGWILVEQEKERKETHFITRNY